MDQIKSIDQRLSYGLIFDKAIFTTIWFDLLANYKGYYGFFLNLGPLGIWHGQRWLKRWESTFLTLFEERTLEFLLSHSRYIFVLEIDVTD